MSARVPVILQNESAECGLACLAMVLAAHGDQRGLAALRAQHGVSIRGADLDSLMKTAECIGLGTRALRLELGELRELRCPAILHWDMQHFVVLVRTDRKGIRVNDPSVGRRDIPWPEVDRRFSGVALEVWPGQNFAPNHERPRIDWSRLLGGLGGWRSGLARVALLALVLEALVLVAPLFMQSVIDDVLVGRDIDLLSLLALAFLALVSFEAAAMMLRSWSIITLSQVLGFAWRGRIFRHLLHLPTDYFAKRSLGEVLSRFESLQVIQRTLSGSLVEACMDGLMALLTVAIMMSLSPLLAAVSVGVIATLLGAQVIAIPVMQRRNEQAIGAGASLQSHAIESIRGIQTLRLASGERLRFQRWQDLTANTQNEQLELDRLSLALRGLTQWLVRVERVVVVWLAAMMVMDQRFSIGLLIAYLAYRDMFSGRASILLERLMELRLLRLHAERLSDITTVEAEPAIDNAPVDQLDLLSLHDCAYRYGETEPWVLKGLSFEIRRGETVAVVGPSGCGKTTLLKLVAGLVTPLHGAVHANGRPLRDEQRRSLRALAGVVMQDDTLFAGSISDNIAGFTDPVDHALVASVARLAAINTDIEALPMGYRSLVGDMGSSLSGGQRQRILLARALYRQPKLLLLDEATSHLDIEGERIVNAAIRTLPAATLIIAHRPETIASADRVLVMDAGRIVHEYRPNRSVTPDVSGGSADENETRSFLIKETTACNQNH